MVSLGFSPSACRRLLCVCAGVASSAWSESSKAAVVPPIINPVSAFTITNDGKFTNASEWSDITPANFLSQPNQPATPLLAGDPTSNSRLYAAIAPGSSVSSHELYLMYDYAPRTLQTITTDEFLADVSFPLNIKPTPALPPEKKFITVQFRGAAGNTVDVKVDTNGDGLPDMDADDLGLESGVGFNPSPLSATQHLLIELEVPLLLPQGFAPFAPNGTEGHGGDGYSPEPSFWGANIAKNDQDPPASSAIFTILPTGQTIVQAIQLPEPSSFAGALLGMGLLMRRGRRGKKPL